MVTRFSATMATNNLRLPAFIKAMQSIYGSFSDLGASSLPEWSPPPMAEGHKGRYLWTDGFAVINFLTLYTETKGDRYLTLAKRLVATVHDVLGRTRDGTSRLPGATDEEPLKGGLRIGKHDEAGSDGDGQYFHYLTVWMFALNRMTVITSEQWYNNQAISMARAVLPRFMVNASSSHPRMFWKMSMDLSHPLVLSQGNLDPIDGYVTYKQLQKTAAQYGDESNILEQEIAALKKMVDAKYESDSSTDTLDLGMTLWTAHWLKDEEEWAAVLTRRAVHCLIRIVEAGYFQRSIARRLAFREFGTALGVQCVDVSDQPSLVGLAESICSTWEASGMLDSESSHGYSASMKELMPITQVMYASALIPGVMRSA